MARSNSIFNQADTNRDGRLSRDEFRDLLTRNSTYGTGTSNFSVGNDFNNLGTGGGYRSSSFQSSSYDTSTTGSAVEADLGYIDAGYGLPAYESSSFQSSVGNIGGNLGNVNVSGGAGISGTDGASTSYSSVSRSSSVQQYETDAQGNFKDSNPQVIRRPALNGPVTYTQNIKVRFLQPPAVPPPGVSSFLTHMTFILLLILASDYQRSTTTATTSSGSTSRPSTSSSSTYTISTYFS
jgi:hypothetical protein